MKRAPRWLSAAAVLAIHERLIAEHGGAAGLRDERLLESALASPLNHLAYADADLFGLAAAYASALTRNHPFHDGNKRVAAAATIMFVYLNDRDLACTEDELVELTLGVARGETTKAAAAVFLATRIR
mgnify:CR=1 FL=1